MVAKLVVEVTEGIGEDFEAARVLYTGTSRRYFRDMVRTRGEFCHEGIDNYINLSEDPFTAMGYARERALFYRDSPVVLVVDTARLDGELYFDGEYRTRRLNVGSFLPYQFSLDDDTRISEEDCSRILEMDAVVTEASTAEIERAVYRFLLTPP